MAIRLFSCAALLALAAGCGPVQSMTVILEASAELEGAKAADGRKFAPYEVVAAEYYLEKALEEQSYADFEPAIVFGTKALEQARKAKQKTTAATGQAPPPGAPPVSDMPSGYDDGTAPAPVQVVPVPVPSDDGGQPSAPIVVPVPE